MLAKIELQKKYNLARAFKLYFFTFGRYLSKMEKANLPSVPSEEAIVPSEEASQPLVCEPEQNTMTAEIPNKAKKHKITFEHETEFNEKPISQSSSNYRQVLSQPAPNLSHKERLLWLQKRRSMGLWAQCDDCKRWRFLEDVLDSHELPDKWYCRLNPDRNLASCLIAEVKLKLSDEEELIHNEYSAGSLVWARMQGWPWWPAMVDDCPDTEQFYWLDGFSDIPTYYNVVFFDKEATRAWISPENLQPYNDYSGNRKFKNANSKKHKQKLQLATKLADQAVNLQLPERLEKFSFVTRYSGHIKTPQKLSKAILEKYQKKLQKKYNIPFPLELQEPSEKAETVINVDTEESVQTNKVIILGTPKKQKVMPRRRILSSEKMSEMIPDSLAPVDSKVLAIEHDDKIKKTADDNFNFLEPNSMSVQLTDSNVNTSTADTAAAQSTFCDIGEASTKTTNMETNATDDETAETNATCNDEDAIANSTQSEPMPLIRIPTPSSDDFDF